MRLEVTVCVPGIPCVNDCGHVWSVLPEFNWIVTDASLTFAMKGRVDEVCPQCQQKQRLPAVFQRSMAGHQIGDIDPALVCPFNVGRHRLMQAHLCSEPFE